MKLPSKFCPQKSVIFRLPNYSDPQETKYLRNNVFESKDTKHIANQEGYFKQQKIMMLFTDIPLKGSSAIFMLTKLIKKGMFAVNVVYHQRDIFSLLDELKWMLLHLILRLVSLGSHLKFSASLRLKFSLLCCQQFKNLHHHMADIFLHLKQKFLQSMFVFT